MFKVLFFFVFVFRENNTLSLIKKVKQRISREIYLLTSKRGLPYGTRGPRT